MFPFHNKVIDMNANIASDYAAWGWRWQVNEGLETQLETTDY